MNAFLLGALLAVAPDAGQPNQGTFTVLFAGDVTLGYHYEEYVDGRLDAGTPRAAALGWGFEKVAATTAAADLFVVNLECPFTARGEKLAKNFNFRARPELVATLRAGNVGAVSLANNHLMDYGEQGLLDTLATLDDAGIPHFGAGSTLAQARAPAVVERRGVRLALLGYYFLGHRNIEPPQVIAADDQPGVAGVFSETGPMEAMVRADVAKARARADVVIPFFHWGREGRHTPEPYQVQLAHAAIEAGAAAVVGSHPHVLQGMELYRGAPVFYSLGNFVFGGNWDPKNKETALVELTVGKMGVTRVRVLPASSDRYPEAPMQPRLETQEKAELVLAHLREYSAGFTVPLPALRAGPDGGETAR